MLLRGIFRRSAAAHDGKWDKSATNSHEVRGRTLGIVGYGNIGSQLSMLAEAMGMKVIFTTDKLRHGSTELVESLQELLARSDIISLHVPDTRARGMIGETELRLMKRGACLINNSRGMVVDLSALAKALRDGHLAGAALDVFPSEPSSNLDRFECPLQGFQNVILTPHIGGSTVEAQDRIGKEVARKMLDYLYSGSTMGAVNVSLKFSCKSASVAFDSAMFTGMRRECLGGCPLGLVEWDQSEGCDPPETFSWAGPLLKRRQPLRPGLVGSWPRVLTPLRCERS